MNKQGKVRFINELLSTIADNIIDDIEAGKIPEDWDGIELRWLIAEKTAASRFNADKRRKREYDNTVLVNNL